MVPQLDPRTKAAADAVKQYQGFVGVIDCDELQIFVTNALVNVKRQLKENENELEGIVKPLVSARRDALTAKQRVEHLFAPVITHLKTAEKILKNELLRYDTEKERKRLEAEAIVRRQAEEEKRRIEAEARREAEEAVRKNIEEQERAAALERAGKEAEAAKVRAEAEENLERSTELVEEKIEEAQQTVNLATVPSSALKLKGTSIPGQWVADLVDIKEALAGIVDGTTPFGEAIRIKVDGRIAPVPPHGVITGDLKVEGVELNLSFFNRKAREEESNFAYRGFRARYARDVRVNA